MRFHVLLSTLIFLISAFFLAGTNLTAAPTLFDPPTIGGGGVTGGVEDDEPETFPNNSPEDLEDEQQAADDAGIDPTTIVSSGGGSGLVPDTLLNVTLKYVVLVDGTVIVGPKFHDGVEVLTHPVLAGGADVTAAGDIEFATGKGIVFVVDITRHSGHYEPSEDSVDHAADVLGEHFPVLGVTKDLDE